MTENDNVSAPVASQTDEAAGTVETATGAGEQQPQQQEGAEATAGGDQNEAPAAPPEDITYHAVEKDGHVTAIWEMQGRRHLRTIDPRSRQGQEILRLYTAEHTEEQSA